MLDLMEPKQASKEAKKPKRPRRAYDIDPELHAALCRRAAKLTLEFRHEVSLSEALSLIMRGDLEEELRELAVEPKRSRK